MRLGGSNANETKNPRSVFGQRQATSSLGKLQDTQEPTSRAGEDECRVSDHSWMMVAFGELAADEVLRFLKG